MNPSPTCRTELLPFLNDSKLMTLWTLLPEARIVGGALRDTLAVQLFTDIDFASPLLPEQVEKRLKSAGIGVIPTGISHGTVTAIIPPRHFQITTLRRDITTDGRRAEVDFTRNWREDASRRDFTINAMSMTREGIVFDYFGGLSDLFEKRIRFVGNPMIRVVEDNLRILRFFRFFAKFDSKSLDTNTQNALSSVHLNFKLLSPERIFSEVFGIFEAPNPIAALEWMNQLGIISTLFPDGLNLAALRALMVRHAPRDAILRLAASLNENPSSFATRFNLSRTHRDRLSRLVMFQSPHPKDNDDTLRKLLVQSSVEDMILRTYLNGGTELFWTDLRLRIRSLRPPKFPLSGRDIIELGERNSKEIKNILRQVRVWWFESGCNAEPEECRKKALDLLRHFTDSPGI